MQTGIHIQNGSVLRAMIQKRLHEHAANGQVYPKGVFKLASTSAVLLLMSDLGRGNKTEPCLIFNKRSARVKQPGDLCFPGGRVSSRLDPLFARTLLLPLSPLGRWPYWRGLRRTRPNQARRLSLLLATGLREGFEEMRLNPFLVQFLGPLPAQGLVLFDRVIYPMAAWIGRQRRFFPNWEVEKVVSVPIKRLLDPRFYGCYRLQMGSEQREHPCFLHEDGGQREILWGATYRITETFLRMIFGFVPPDMCHLASVEGSLSEAYLGPDRKRGFRSGNPKYESRNTKQ